MATRIDIRDQIISEYEYKNLDLHFLTGLTVHHDFYDEGTIQACCNECGQLTVEFASEDLTITIGLSAVFWDGCGFNFDRKELRKRYKAHQRHHLAYPQTANRHERLSGDQRRK